jgi:hypothetical protein
VPFGTDPFSLLLERWFNTFLDSKNQYREYLKIMKSKLILCGITGVIWGLIPMLPNSLTASSLRLDKVDFKEKGQEMLIESEHVWKAGYPQITGVISSTEDINVPTYIYVYFFDKDKKPIGELKKISCTRSYGKNGQELGISAPERLVRRTEMLFMVEVPQSLIDQKWDRAIVVFGTATDAIAEAIPRANVEEYEFPEKELVLKSKTKDAM